MLASTAPVIGVMITCYQQQHQYQQQAPGKLLHHPAVMNVVAKQWMTM
jgi:hypothetical protein